MKRFPKAALAALALVTVLVLTGCRAELTPYETNNEKGYTVSVKYDANGGIFTTNTSVIVDSFNASAAPTGTDGKTAIALLSPDDAARGNDAFRAVNNGHFLAGWYQERVETTDADGHTTYTYSGKWDFANDRLAVDPSGTYTAEEPVMTLYAAWIPLFEIAFYDRASGELVQNYTYDPTAVPELPMPAWDEESGTLEMFQFPEREGYTFDKAYYDADGKQAVTAATIAHTGTIDEATGTATGAVMNLRCCDYFAVIGYEIEAQTGFGLFYQKFSHLNCLPYKIYSPYAQDTTIYVKFQEKSVRKQGIYQGFRQIIAWISVNPPGIWGKASQTGCPAR